MSEDHDIHHVHRIELPSGKAIEVVRFDEPTAAPPSDLHVCPGCASELVQPVAWEEVTAESWKLTLRCPNCWWIGEGVCQQHQIEQLEDRLDEGVETILSDLQRLTQANLTDQIDRFVVALHADLILPEDF